MDAKLDKLDWIIHAIHLLMRWLVKLSLVGLLVIIGLEMLNVFVFGLVWLIIGLDY